MAIDKGFYDDWSILFLPIYDFAVEKKLFSRYFGCILSERFTEDKGPVSYK